MPRPDSSRIEEIFNDALDVPAEERAAFLDTVCGSDTELRREVDSLLSAYAEGSDYLDDFADAVIQLSAEQGLPALNARVGPYELVEAVGQGGMGVVYRARRIDGQFDREVAVKLLRNDLFGPAARGRFEAERVILARLTHPNIARLLDAGVAEVAGQAPYLVMEWAPGEPITGYVRRHNLSVEERVRLVVTVCSAVQHAHGRLVIHRDLKPSNILVSDGEDGRPDVRLLDFGIAKLLDGSADGLPLTQTGDRWMTPEYASPEQITGGDVTTRTDVYQIGVLLYELLTGQTPFQTEGDRRHELARMVVETEPVKPSDRLTQPSAQRTAGTQRFRRQIEGDLDMIVMKALRKEPDRRYVSVDALAEDLRLHLAGFPINARPDSVQYRVRKFVQRNRGGVLAAVVLALLVMTYAVTVTVQREQIEQERNRAEAAVGFLSSVFQVSDPNIAQGDTLTADEILLRGAERAATIEDTELRGDMQRLLGQLLFQLGRSTASVALLDGAVDSYEEAGDQAAALAGSFNDLARAHYLAEIGGRDTAVVVAKQAMEIADRSGSRLERARALANLGRALALQRDEEQRDEIVSMLEESVRIHRSIDSESEELADAMEYLGNYYYSIREYDNVIALSGNLLLLRQALEPEAGIGTARAMQMRELALSQSEGPTAESDSLIDGALAIYTRILGPGHYYTLNASNNRALALKQRGRFDEARHLYEQTIGLAREHLGEAHSFYSSVRYNYATLLRDTGYYEDSKAILGPVARRIVEDLERGGALSFSSARSLTAYGNVLRLNGEYREAEAMLSRSYAFVVEAVVPGHPSRALAAAWLGDTRSALGRHEEGARLIAAAEAGLAETMPDGHWYHAYVDMLRGEVELRRGDRAMAQTYLENAHAGLRAARDRGDEDPYTQQAAALLIQARG